MKIFIENKIIFSLILSISFSFQKGIADQKHSQPMMQKKENQNQEEIHSQKLQTLFAQFQKQYLNFEFKKAQTSLKQIIALRFLRDWNVMERKIISTCYLKLAQMDELYRYQWVDEFLAFNEQAFIDSDIFPPPFVNWVKNKQQEYHFKTTLWYGQNLPENIEAVIINGETFKRLGFSRRINPKFKYRMTFIEQASQDDKQDKSIPNFHFSMVLNGKDLISYPFDPSKSIAEIETLQNFIQKSSKSYSPYENLNKIQESNRNNVLLEDNKKQNKRISRDMISKLSKQHPFQNIMSQETIEKSSIKANITESLKKPIKKDSSKNFFKKPWLWITLGGLATGIVISMQSKSKTKKKIRRHSSDIVFQ